MQVVEKFVDFVDLSVLLLPLEMDLFVELSKIIQVSILQSVVPLEQGLYLAAILGLLDRDFQSELWFRLSGKNDGSGRYIRSNRSCFCFWLRFWLFFNIFFFFYLLFLYFCFRLFGENRFWLLNRDRLLRESWRLPSGGFSWRFDRRWSILGRIKGKLLVRTFLCCSKEFHKVSDFLA